MYRKLLRALAGVVIVAGCSGGPPPAATNTRLELNVDRLARRGGYSAVSFKVERAALFYGHSPEARKGHCSLAGGLERPFSSTPVQFDLLSTGTVRVGEMDVLPGRVAELRLLVSDVRVELNGRWVDAEMKEDCREKATGRELGMLRLVVPERQVIDIGLGELERVRMPFDPNRDIIVKRSRPSNEPHREHKAKKGGGNHDDDDDDDDDDGDDDDDSGAGHGSHVQLCHVPPGNPTARHTLWVAHSAVPAHLAHGDQLGACPSLGDGGTPGSDAGHPALDAGSPPRPDSGEVFDPCADGGVQVAQRLILASRYELLPLVPAGTFLVPLVQLGAQECRYDVLEAFENPSSQTPGDAERVYEPPLRFAVPAQLRVVEGNAGNHLTRLTWWLGGVRTECVYRGTASAAHPVTALDVASGRRYMLVSCTTRTSNTCAPASFKAGDVARADALQLHVEGDGERGLTSVRVALADADPCVVATVSASQALIASAAGTRSGQGGLIVIPESAYRAALASAAQMSPPDAMLRNAAMAAGIGNDPWTGGIVANYESSAAGIPFSGDAFIVARNPLLISGSQFMQATDYSVAVARLSGTTPWRGTAYFSTIQPSDSLGTGSCCGTVGRGSCELSAPGSCGGGGGDCNPSDSYCVGQVIQVTSTEPWTSTAEDERAQSGQAPIPMQVNVSSFDGSNNPPFPLPCDFSCNPPPVPECGVQTLDCDHENPTTYTGDWNVLFPGKDICMGQAQSRPVGGREVPEYCTQTSSYSQVPTIDSGGNRGPPDCGHVCWACGLQYCEGTTCDAQIPEVPPFCGVAEFDETKGDLCVATNGLNAARRQMEQAAMFTLAISCRPGATPRTAGGCCGVDCYCEATNERGVQVCTNCQSGTCVMTARVPQNGIDPTVAGKKTIMGDTIEIIGKVEGDPTKEPKQPADPAKDALKGEFGNKSNPPPKPDPAPPKPEPQPGGSGASNTTKSADQADQPPPLDKKKGDPVALGDGALDVTQTDLSFPGPVRPLTFTRTYRSASDERSPLGSNWTHNWDVWLELVTQSTRPSWLDAYCGGTHEQVTCVFLHGPDGSSKLFYFDYQTALFLPQAGSFDTLLKTPTGWKLRSPDGRVRHFNKEGHLAHDRDRFGNGFAIDYEPTPLYRLFRHVCATTPVQPKTTLEGRGPLEGVTETKLLSSQCRLLAGMLGLHGLPPPGHAAWKTTATDFSIPAGDSSLSFALSYFLSLKGTGPEGYAPYGTRLLRPTRVTDDEGRSLALSYKPDSSSFDSQLLAEVRGPAGTTVHFSYETPPNHPPELHEAFLKRVERLDSPPPGTAGVVAAQPRSIVFDYLWQGALQAPSTAHADAVEKAWLDYYFTFVGCAFHTILPCGAPGRSTFSPGDPTPMAKVQRNLYLSRVADNLLSINVAGTLEAESRYRIEPFAFDFDRVLAQRFGSSSVGSRPQGPAAFSWASSLPYADFDYRSAGGESASGPYRDATEGFLPAPIRTRYPIEPLGAGAQDCLAPSNLPALAEGEVVATGHSTTLSEQHSPVRPACRFGEADERALALPGARAAMCYFDSSRNGIDVDAPLLRSAVSCEQLAVAQTWDSTHNDLLSTLVPNEATASNFNDYFAVKLTGRRRVMAANANRICAWARYADRDGDVRYTGLNYQGLVLVDALLQKNGTFLFTEALYTADGDVASLRRPLPEGTPWVVAQGDTVYTHDEIEPAGNSGWNLWQPAYWARRANIVFTQVRPQGGLVENANEGTPPVPLSSAGRFTRTRYEPLFNQPLKHEEGWLFGLAGSGNVPIVTRRLEWLYDYQELSLDDPMAANYIGPVLESLRPFGFSWLGPAIIKDWQLPVASVYDAHPATADVNGDGFLGHTTDDAQRRGVGVPVQLLDYGADGTTFEAYSFVWAPHGQPARVQAPGGAVTTVSYLPHGEVAPTSTNLSAGNVGFLGRTRTLSGATDYPLTEGPPQPRCASLSGPWQWLLPASCGSSVASGLLSAGLPQATVDAILDSRPMAGALTEDTHFSWNAAGGLRTLTEPNGALTSMTRDTDGRLVSLTDPTQVTSFTTYTALGFPEREERTGPAMQALGKTLRTFDEEGHVLHECVELRAGGCVAGNTAPGPGQGVARSASYTREGLLQLSRDGEGTATYFAYDARKLVTHVQTLAIGTVVGDGPTTHIAPPDGPVRTESFVRDNDGMVISASHGSGLTSESFTYDGLMRLRRHVDTLQRPWVVATSGRDVVISVGLEPPVSLAVPWDVELRYDNFARLVEEKTNGFVTNRLFRREGGLPFARTAAGEGARFATYDAQGRLVYEEDSAGNQRVYTFSPARRQSTEVSLEVGARQSLAVGVVRDFDALWRVTAETERGGGLSRTRRHHRLNPLGFVTTLEEADSAETRFTPNLLGWADTIQQQRAIGGAQFDETVYEYNARGQVKRVTDAATSRTDQFYNGFGEVKERLIQGTPGVQTTFEYDTLGQLTRRTVGPTALSFVYNSKAQLTDIVNGLNEPLIVRTYDPLGRLATAINTNAAARTLPPANAGRAGENTFGYDSLGRLAMDRQRVDAQPFRDVTSVWSIGGNGRWQRQVTYPAGTAYLERFDGDGRLVEKSRVGSAGTRTYDYVGDRYAGRNIDRQSVSPLRQHIGFDGLGQPLSWSVRVVDLDSSGQPVNSAEGTAWCGGPWTAACARPLLAIDVLRDVRGRAVSANRSWALPLGLGPADETWRGYLFDAMSRLSTTFERSALVSTSGFSTHSIVPANVRQLATGSTEWGYQRETAVGDLLSIAQVGAPATRRFEAAARGPGHQLVSVTPPGGTARNVVHDGAGRMTSDGESRYEWDDLHELAVVSDLSGVLKEGFLYDGIGRLVGTVAPDTEFPPQPPPGVRLIRNVLVYDGLQAIAAFKTDVAGNPPVEWQTSWGPGIDNLESVTSAVARSCGGAQRSVSEQCALANIETFAILDNRNSVVGALAGLFVTADYTPEGVITLKNGSTGQVVCDGATDLSCVGPTGAPFGFNGAYKSSRGLVHMRNRWYSPALAQFLSHDPIGFADSYSLYAFAGFDPINNWDPFGLSNNSLAGTNIFPQLPGRPQLPLNPLLPRPPLRGPLGPLQGYNSTPFRGATPSAGPGAQGARAVGMTLSQRLALVLGTLVPGNLGQGTTCAATSDRCYPDSLDQYTRYLPGPERPPVSDPLVTPAIPGGGGVQLPAPEPRQSFVEPRADSTTRRAIDLVNPARRKHILEGDKTGGGHRPGLGRPGKSEFPPGWSDTKIIESIEDVATDPTSKTSPGLGVRVVIEGTRDGVDIRVIVDPTKDEIITGFPTNTPKNP